MLYLDCKYSGFAYTSRSDLHPNYLEGTAVLFFEATDSSSFWFCFFFLRCQMARLELTEHDIGLDSHRNFSAGE